jgi:hypothetical protein
VTTNVKIYGARRTGTNYLEELLCKNLDNIHIHSRSPEGKHNLHTLEIMEGWTVVVIAKNPWAWFDSFQRYEEEHGVECNWVGNIIRPIIGGYLAKYKSWVERADVIIRYEDFIQDAKTEVLKVANEAGVSVRDFENIDNVVSYDGQEGGAFDTFYYEEDVYLLNMTQSQASAIQHTAYSGGNRLVMEDLGYANERDSKYEEGKERGDWRPVSPG